jgi:guanylate kinase
VFIVPPDLATLENRLRRRHTDDPAEIDRRLAAARREIEQATFYSHWIVNDDLDRACGELEAVLTAERLRATDKVAMRDALLGPGAGPVSK